MRLYADAAGTNVLWTDTYTVQVTGGIFNIALGSGAVPLPASTVLDQPLWLSMQIGEAPELRPFSALTASVYALNVPDASITAAKSVGIRASDGTSNATIGVGGAMWRAGGGGRSLGGGTTPAVPCCPSAGFASDAGGATPESVGSRGRRLGMAGGFAASALLNGRSAVS